MTPPKTIWLIESPTAFWFSRVEVNDLPEDVTVTKMVAAQQEQEPVAYIHRNEYNEYRLEPHDNFDIKSIPFNVDVPLFKGAA